MKEPCFDFYRKHEKQKLSKKRGKWEVKCTKQSFFSRTLVFIPSAVLHLNSRASIQDRLQARLSIRRKRIIPFFLHQILVAKGRFLQSTKKTKSLIELEKNEENNLIASNCEKHFFFFSFLSPVCSSIFFFFFSSLFFYFSMDQVFSKNPTLKSKFNKNFHFDYKPIHSTFVYDKFIKDFDKAISR